MEYLAMDKTFSTLLEKVDGKTAGEVVRILCAVCLIKIAAPVVRHTVDRLYDLGIAKIAVEHGRLPVDISNRFECDFECDTVCEA